MKRVRFVKNYRGPLTNRRQMIAGDVWTYEDAAADALVEAGVATLVTVVTQPVSTAAPAPPTREPVDVDDPADHTVAEVADYAAHHHDALDRLIEQEEAGEQRVTLLRALRTMRESRDA